MNRQLLFLLFVFFSITLSVRSQVVSIRPSTAVQGQTLTTTITVASGLFSSISPPMGMQDIYLQQGNTVINCNYFDPSVNIYPGTTWPFFWGDSLFTDFTIPPNAPSGPYDVHVITYTYDPITWWYIPSDNVLTGGFHVGIAAGTLEGNVFFDANQNGVYDGIDFPVSNQRILCQPDGYYVFTNAQGDYKVYADTGAIAVSPVLGSGFSVTSPTAVHTVSVPPSHTGLDFGIYSSAAAAPSQSFSVLKTLMRCVSSGLSNFTLVNNSYVQSVQQGSVTVIHSPNLVYNSAAGNPLPSYVSGDTMVWNYSGLANGQSFSVPIQYQNPPAGDTVWYQVIDSVFDSNNQFIRVYTDAYTTVVRCSFDPNDKAVYPEGVQAQNYVLTDTELEYRIRFQNTGTDTAFTVIIYDTLDANLDFNTFRVMSSSHPVDVRMTANGELEFIHTSILLPDSITDEPGSNGYVIYLIAPLANLPDFTMVENTAHIVFDINSPVVTNTTLTTYVTMIPLGVSDVIQLSAPDVYPNPVTGESYINLDQTGGTTYSLSVTDRLGRVVMQKQVSSDELIIRKSDFLSGIYFYHLRSKDGARDYKGKFIVE